MLKNFNSTLRVAARTPLSLASLYSFIGPRYDLAGRAPQSKRPATLSLLQSLHKNEVASHLSDIPDKSHFANISQKTLRIILNYRYSSLSSKKAKYSLKESSASFSLRLWRWSRHNSVVDILSDLFFPSYLVLII